MNAPASARSAQRITMPNANEIKLMKPSANRLSSRGFRSPSSTSGIVITIKRQTPNRHLRTQMSGEIPIQTRAVHMVGARQLSCAESSAGAAASYCHAEEREQEQASFDAAFATQLVACWRLRPCARRSIAPRLGASVPLTCLAAGPRTHRSDALKWRFLPPWVPDKC